MRRIKTLMKSTALAGAAAMLAMPAYAMTCAEFSAMSEEGQKGAIMGIEAGRAEARRMARGDDPDADPEEVIVSTDEDIDGQEEQRETGRGEEEVLAKVVTLCEDDPEMRVTDVMPPEAGHEE